MLDTWESLPDLNIARYGHSSCILGMKMYVLGGKDNTRQITNSIEKLKNIAEPAPITISQWQRIIPEQSFRPRTCPVFCAWNKREIVILGGYNYRESVNDGWVFDS